MKKSERIYKLLRAGVAEREIAERVGVSRGYVSQIRHRLGVASEDHAERRYTEGWNFFVTGRRRATAHDDFWRGWNAAQAANATALIECSKEAV